MWRATDATQRDARVYAAAVTDAVLLSISREKFVEFTRTCPSLHVTVSEIGSCYTSVSLRTIPFFSAVVSHRFHALVSVCESQPPSSLLGNAHSQRASDARARASLARAVAARRTR